MANKLRFRVRVLAFRQTRKVLIAHSTGQSPLFRKLTLPLAMPLLVAAPIALALRSKLPLMVRPRL